MGVQKLERIQKVFANNRFATDNGAIIEQVDEGCARCWLEIQPHHLNIADIVVGRVIFILADLAFAVASNWNRPLHILTASQITYLGVARDMRLIAEARKVRGGRSTRYYLVEVKDDLGSEIAHITTNNFSRGQKNQPSTSCAFSPSIPNRIFEVSDSNYAKVPKDHLK